VTRVRAAWLAVGLLVFAALGYVVLRRGSAAAPLPVSAPLPTRAPALPRVTTAPPAVSPLVEDPVDEPVVARASVDDPEPVIGAELAAPVSADEKPLATWARVAIVVVALMAFFAVSLLATKRV